MTTPTESPTTPTTPAPEDWAAAVRVLTALRDRPDEIDHPDREAVERLAARLNRTGRKRRRKDSAADRHLADRLAVEATGRVRAEPPPVPPREEDVDTREGEPDEAPDEPPSSSRVHRPRTCHVCGGRYRDLHPHYHKLCPPCAAFNWRMRTRRTDLSGRRALVTGGRVKIGFAVALRLLRDGAAVDVTSRFPADAVRRFAAEPDFAEWRDRLRVHGLDLRDIPAVAAFADRLDAETGPRGLDILVNNAAQTVRRRPGAMSALIADEPSLGRDLRALLAAPTPATVASAVPALPGPSGFRNAVDAEGFLPDPSQRNSWTLRADEVEPSELVEALLINTAAPFVLLGRLLPALRRSRAADRHVVNVSAAEGRFSRTWKSAAHPHTNMAKAGLNMLTRTTAAELAAEGIFVNAVDPGWISRENPLPTRADLRSRGDVPPLDAADAAARVCDPIHRARAGHPVWGQLWKDFEPTEW